MNVGDIFFGLRGDGGPLLVDAQKAAEAAGVKAGGSFSASFKSKLAAGAGAAIGAAFGIAASGAVELDAATRKLQADTGMTGEEAQKASHALAGMYRDNLQGFDAIGAAMAKVHNDLGLTGDDADKATAKFLKFGTATGQDAAAAVTALDDVLDNWGLTAADATTIMDKLIVSHQKFGGELTETQATLAKLGPAMRAANFEIDDGIALLGLFGAKGLNAERAAAAMSKALTKVKSPAELKRLIVDISDTIDPFERARKAADLFGAKAGAQLANALGGVNLDDYAISMGEAAGATEKAAAVIEGSWGNQFKLFLKNAGGKLAEFGQSFGPLLIVAAQFGPKFTTAIASGLGGLAGMLIPRVTAAVAATGIPAALAGTQVGTMIGTAIAAAVPVGISLGLGLGAAAIGGAIGMAIVGPEVDKAKRDLTEKTSRWVTEATLDALIKSRDDVAAQMERVPTLLGWDVFGGKEAIQKTLDEIDAAIAERSARMVRAAAKLSVGAQGVMGQAKDAFVETWKTVKAATTAQAMQSAVGTITSYAEGVVKAAKKLLPIAAEDVIDIFGTHLGAVRWAAKRTGVDGMLAMAAGITAARAKPLDAFDTLREMLKHSMTRTAEAARLAGELTSKELARGLRSNDPAVRAQAEATKKAILDRLVELQASNGLGKKAMAELEKGIHSKDPEIRAAAKRAKDIVLAKLRELKDPAGVAGANAGAAFARELLAKVTAAAAGLIALAAGLLKNPPVVPHTPVPGAASGVAYVPHEQVYRLHTGEGVLTAQQNRERRVGLTGETMRVELYHHVDGMPVGTSATEVARILNAGVDASGLARAVRLRAGVR